MDITILDTRYDKIQSLYKRDSNKNMIFGDYTLPEFSALAECRWDFYEKIDGTNIRIDYYNGNVYFRGREATPLIDGMSMPINLLEFLRRKYTVARLKDLFGDTNVTLYGEGVGEGISKEASRYSDTNDYILFDIKINNYWLFKNDVRKYGNMLDTDVVQYVATGTLDMMKCLVRDGFDSAYGVDPEGLIAIPEMGFLTRGGKRIITKLKRRDFRVK